MFRNFNTSFIQLRPKKIITILVITLLFISLWNVFILPPPKHSHHALVQNQNFISKTNKPIEAEPTQLHHKIHRTDNQQHQQQPSSVASIALSSTPQITQFSPFAISSSPKVVPSTSSIPSKSATPSRTPSSSSSRTPSSSHSSSLIPKTVKEPTPSITSSSSKNVPATSSKSFIEEQPPSNSETPSSDMIPSSSPSSKASKSSPSFIPSASTTPTSSTSPTSTSTPTSSSTPSSSSLPKASKEHPIVVDLEEPEPEHDSLRDSIDRTHQERMQHKQSKSGHTQPQDPHLRNRDPPRDSQKMHHDREGRDGYDPGREHEMRELNSRVENNPNKKANNIVAPVVVIACNRPSYLKRALDSIFKYHTGDIVEQFPVIVSQDCGQEEVSKLIGHYKNKLYKHIQHPNLSPIDGYGAISRHYKWALGQVFDEMKFDHVILVEEDLDIAVDFFEYFEALQPMFQMDPTVWCISAWNDNGMENNVRNPEALFRTDWFPGLGWMLQRSLWDELKGKWPARYWDDWLRKPEQRKNRVCIRPEISRTFTFGEVGVSHGQFYGQYLARIRLNNIYVPFTEVNITYLQRDHFDLDWVKKVDRANLVTNVDLTNLPGGDLKFVYKNWDEFKNLATNFGIMTDQLEGVPRTSYMGVVTFWHNWQKVYLVPSTFEETHTHVKRRNEDYEETKNEAHVVSVQEQ